MKVRRLLNKLQHGEKGFTLIELLVVVAILGILAAVIILNVMGMIGSGQVEAANTEAHNVQIAVLAAMVDNDVYKLTAGGWVYPNNSDIALATGNTDTITEFNTTTTNTTNYLTGILQAEYEIDTDGSILSASEDPYTHSKWSGLTYYPDGGWKE